MLKFCEAFLRHRKVVVGVFALLALACALCIPQVKVNYSMVDYLPEDAESVIALNDMENAFDSATPNARAYVEGIDLTTADALSASLGEIEGVSDVMWLGTAVDTRTPTALQDESLVSKWKTDNGYLFQMAVQSGKQKAAVDEVRAACEATGASQVSLSGEAVSTASAQKSTATEVSLILVVGVVIIALILLLTSHSWFEPVIFLTVIGVAIVLNMGTNIFRGEISFVSQICGAILQLAVSMDYAIVLLHTFRRCQREYPDPEEAMAHAMKRGFSVVLSSAAVTFFGFLSLTVMRFGIGVDMGIVLAKGIVFSFFTVMFLMPCLILMSLRPLEATKHRFLIPPFDRFARVCQRLMVPMAVIVVLVAVPAYLGEGRTDFQYGSSDFNTPESQLGKGSAHVDEAFGESQTWVVMVPEGHWAEEQQLLDALEATPGVTGVTSYLTVAGRALPTEVVPESTLSQVVSNGWSRLAVTIDASVGSDRAFGLVETVRGAAQQYYGDAYRLVGNDVSTYDLRDTCQEDSSRVKLFSMLAIGIVLAVMFRSISLPFLILIAIEVSIWINLAIPYFLGEHLNYIGYLVIDAVQLGAAVDYAIIYAREYFERRAGYPPAEAARSAVKHAGLTILTSSSILMFAGVAVWLIASNGVISQLGVLVGRGAFLAMLMMFVFLPWLFKTFDGLICRTTYGLQVYGGRDGAGKASQASISR